MDDRLAWITGASTGIGNALALRMARDGWRIAASARSADTLEIMARESQGRVSAHPLDVTDEAASAQVAETIWREERPSIWRCWPPACISPSMPPLSRWSRFVGWSRLT